MWDNEDVVFAESLSRYAHRGQVDKAGMPYYLHPMAVAGAVDSNDLKIVAWLHDVLEDTNITESTLRNLFGDEIVDIVVLLTRPREMDYLEYIERLRVNPKATAVKRADLQHNMDLTRLREVTPKDLKRREKYIKALKLLEE